MNAIIFDYDNVLYDYNLGIEQNIDTKITEFISKKLKISNSEANKIRNNFFLKYGTTIQGLIEEYNISPEEYYNFINDIDLPLTINKKLISTLNNLKCDKYIFSNSHKNFINRGLKLLGIKDYFSDIFDINYIEYKSKPNLFGYQKINKNLSYNRYNKIYFIDDRAVNLHTALNIGWEPILLNCHQEINDKFIEIDSLYYIKEIINA